MVQKIVTQKLLECALFLKRQSKRQSVWIVLGCMVILTFLYKSITVPEVENNKVLICQEGNPPNSELFEQLQAFDSAFVFEQVSDSQEVCRQVMSQDAECGFIFPEDFEAKMEKGETKGLITYVCSGFTTKGSVAIETVHAQIFKLYSASLLTQHAQELFTKADEKLIQDLIQTNSTYLEGEQEFQLQQEKVSVSGQKKSLKANVYPLHGILSAMIFLYLLLIQAEMLETSERGFFGCQTPAKKRWYGYLNTICGGLLLTIGMLLCLYLGNEGKNFLHEIFCAFLFLLFAGVWVNIVSRLLVKTFYFAWIFTLFATSLLLSDAFWNLSTYVPAVKYLNWLTPVGFYLNLL